MNAQGKKAGWRLGWRLGLYPGRCLALCLALCLVGGCAAQTESPPPDSGSPPAAAPGFAAVADYGFTPPAGFVLQEDGVTYRAPDYPRDASTIRLAVTARDPYFNDYTSEMMGAALEETLRGQLGEDVAVTVEEFAYSLIDTLPAWRLQVRYSYDGQEICQLTVAVNAACRYAFTFTAIGTDDWQQPFADSANSIWFLLE